MIDDGPMLRNDSPGWTDWGFPPRRVTVRHSWAGGPRSGCCGKLPGELPASDRLVVDVQLVDCPA